jgi:hypothetical protein
MNFMVAFFRPGNYSVEYGNSDETDGFSIGIPSVSEFVSNHSEDIEARSFVSWSL